MTAARHPAHSAVADMEGDIHDLQRIASLLRHLSGGSCQMDPGDLSPIADLLHDMGSRLHGHYRDAFDALKVQP